MIEYFEKVNPAHPDKVADRIAGALVDLAYKMKEDPKIAVEVLIGHGECNIISESDVKFEDKDVLNIVKRISKQDSVKLNLKQVPQDPHLSENQKELRCGDNGVFKGVPAAKIESDLVDVAEKLYKKFPSDGKYLIRKNALQTILTICQSNAETKDIEKLLKNWDYKVINPLGYWTGGTDVDCGATNRKLGSDMGRAVTGGGLHGKDLSKADVSVNIYCNILARSLNTEVNAICNIGDKYVTITYSGKEEKVEFKDIVNDSKTYIKFLGGFEKLAEWGLI